MLDTLTIGAHVDGLTADKLVDAGWVRYSKASKEGGSDLWCTHELGGVRLAYMCGIGWLSGEVSLPKLLGRDNAELLTASECRDGASLLGDVITASVGGALEMLEPWSVSRFDAVWAWPVDAALYLGALGVARLPRTQRVGYESGVRWVGGTGKHVKGRAYNKSIEEKHEVGLPFRLELQVRRKQTVTIDGRKVGHSLGEVLSERVALGLVRRALSDLGLDKPIPSMGATRALLIERYGKRTGRAAWVALRDLWDFGGVWPSDVEKWTARRYERLWRGAGVSAVSPEGELPALTVGEAG